MKNKIIQGRTVYDGAGVKIHRIFSRDFAELTDPFLMLDHFGSEDPADYLKGFPWHPHRGIETVTYMLGGEVEHGDSLGNSGLIKPGEIQWMTAGGGVIHQEMPKASKEKMHGLQLWVNLPSKSKMMAPRYRDIRAKEIPLLKESGVEIRVIAGSYYNITGPVKELVIPIDYWDIRLGANTGFTHSAQPDKTRFCYVIEGEVKANNLSLTSGSLLLVRNEKEIEIKAETQAHYLFAAGTPLKEPIAWGGPIVMNTQEELDTAFQELDQGRFIK